MLEIRTRGELLSFLDKMGKEYRLDCEKSINRNNHMNELEKHVELNQDIIDAILVDFINFIGINQNVDYGLYAKDWKNI